MVRPPNCNEDLVNLENELDKHGDNMIGTVLIGDMNIHHNKWLRFSNNNTPVGDRLLQLSLSHNLHEYVRNPPRGDYLLDLAPCSVLCAVKTKMMLNIVDHNAVMITLNIPQIQKVRAPRMVWDYRNADWNKLQADLGAVDWKVMKTMSAFAAAPFLASKILSLARSRIP